MSEILIAPSLLTADLANLESEIKKVEDAGADLLHLDIMDGHFVPNLTFGPPLVKCIRKITNLPLDAHLMVDNPEELIAPFADAGVDIITVHVETTKHLHRLIQSIKEKGIQAGIALNPATPLSSISEVLNLVDLVLLMSVNPGFGGQEFIQNVFSKIYRLKRSSKEFETPFKIQVDGGVNLETKTRVIKSGADILVVGSAIYGASDIKETIKNLRKP